MRQQVHAKYDGKCAYCGTPITLEQMQIDHIEPLHRGRMQLPEEVERLQHINNLNPACGPCNNRKRTHPLEEFREEIAAQIFRLRRDSNQFRLAERFGLVTVNEQPVVFHFEL